MPLALTRIPVRHPHTPHTVQDTCRAPTYPWHWPGYLQITHTPLILTRITAGYLHTAGTATGQDNCRAAAYPCQERKKQVVSWYSVILTVRLAQSCDFADLVAVHVYIIQLYTSYISLDRRRVIQLPPTGVKRRRKRWCGLQRVSDGDRSGTL